MSIFTENIAYRPFQYPWAVEVEKTHRIKMNWHEDQVELADDLRQWNSKGGLATENIPDAHNRNLLEKLIPVFTEMDVQVGTGYTRLLPHVKNNEIRTMMMTFAAREIVHQRGYALAAEVFGFTNADWSEFKTYRQMQDKIDILSEEIGDLDQPLQFAKQLATVLLGEGISLFGAFACLLNMRRFGLMQNFNVVNEWSLKDEQEHVSNNMRVLGLVKSEDLSPTEIVELNAFIETLVERYVQAEKEFLKLVFEMGPQEDLTLEQACDFIDYLGELRKYEIGVIDEMKLVNPLPWIDYILSAGTHTNFFESRVVDYSHKKLEGKPNYEKYASMLENKKLMDSVGV